MGQRIALLDGILEDWRGVLAADFSAYRNHCCRVLQLACAFAGAMPDDQEKIAIAAAFHDLGIWEFSTFDYLDGSQALARRYLVKQGLPAWTSEVEAMIGWHHKLTPYRGEHTRLVEAFRKADWIDVSLGLLRCGLPKAVIASARAAFPNRGFHGCLARLTLRRLRSHPLSPLPMMRW